VLRACRPRQWVKNVLVVLAPGAAGALTRPGTIASVFAALIGFCLLSSATYLINDVRDLEQDRRHPRKRMRPIAAGELAPRGALRIAAVLALLGLGICAAVRPALAAVGVAYLALTTTYSIWWRHLVFLDILAIASGFVLRAVAGGVAAGVALSESFLLVTSACAVFLIVGKRYAELLDGAARERRRGSTRTTLRRYSRRLLSNLLVGAAAVGCVAYARWAFSRPEGGPWLELSLVPFALWLARYGTMVGAGAGEAPEELILRDRLLLVLGAVWVALFAGGVYGSAG
jgi:decaprenyl-phosphate phosphoribosyltransferase